MVRIDLEEAKRDFNRCIDLVEQGETLVILRHSKEIAEIRSLGQDEKPPRPYGLCEGEFSVPDDFDESPPEHLISEFEGE